ncbi:hypothetical protein U1Q18_052429 [Sarracenia purpurea var. burkii]
MLNILNKYLQKRRIFKGLILCPWWITKNLTHKDKYVTFFFFLKNKATYTHQCQKGCACTKEKLQSIPKLNSLWDQNEKRKNEKVLQSRIDTTPKPSKQFKMVQNCPKS